MSRRTAAPRGAFTLIELLVVIAILAVLVALLVPAAMRVKGRADIAAERQTIGQIASAIGAYKAKMQVRYIPAAFVVYDNYESPAAKANVNAVASAAYLYSIFPQIDRTATTLGTVYGGDGTVLDGNQTLTLFLTGGLATNYQGFSTNRRYPFTAATTGDNRLGPFYNVTPKTTNARGQLVDRWRTPYAYFAHNPLQGVGTYTGAAFTVTTDDGTSTVSAFLSQAAVGTTPAKYLEPTGFQIISAGPDTLFGPGGLWVPRSGVYIEEQVGGDDIANFATGTLSSN